MPAPTTGNLHASWRCDIRLPSRRKSAEFRLTGSALSLRLTCTNQSGEPMPCGLGQHPYFPCGPATRIDTAVASVWTIDENVLPVERVPATARFDLTDRLVCGQHLDQGFGGWGGLARITDPGWPFAIRLSSHQLQQEGAP